MIRFSLMLSTLLAGCGPAPGLDAPAPTPSGTDVSLGDDDDDDVAGDDDDDDDEPACVGSGFASTAASYELPPGYARHDASGALPAFDQIAAADWFCDAAQNEIARTAVLDLTGDGLPDLVFLEDGCDDPEIGSTRWKVYPGGPDGFGAEISWALPAGYTAHDFDGPLPFADLSKGAWSCDPARTLAAQFVLLDLTGDGRLDLVFTEDGCDDAAIGATRWKVYPGGDGGFGAAQSWDLPAGYTAHDFEGPQAFANPFVGAWSCDASRTRAADYELLDLTGDGLLDLVFVLDACDDAAIGTTRWKVHPGGDGGFLDEISWDLPSGYTLFGASGPMAPFTELGGWAWACDAGRTASARFSLLDLTGDAQPDLVFTEDGCDDPAIGVTRWKVYPGAADGFGPEASWALPKGHAAFGASGRVPPFADLGGWPWSCDAGQTASVRFSLLDLTGDARPDLVFTEDGCDDAAIGSTRWKVHPATVDGFDAETSWALPAGYPAPAFTDLGGWPWSCDASGSASFSLLDLTGDGLLDLVFTEDGCDDAAIGATRWKVHEAECE